MRKPTDDAVPNSNRLELDRLRDREAATRDILTVMSQSRDNEVLVFDTILKHAEKLCRADGSGLQLLNAARTHLQFVAVGTWDDHGSFPIGMEFDLAVPLGMCIAVNEARVVHYEDLKETDLYREGHEGRRKLVDVEGVRTHLNVPLVLDGTVLGNITLSRRQKMPFSDDDIALVETFAAQAVMAIENVRHVREVQTRLERETASREILGVISQSRDDEGPVFDAILENACRLCNAPLAYLSMATEDRAFAYSPARRGAFAKFGQTLDKLRVPLTTSRLALARSIAECKVFREDNIADHELYTGGDPNRVSMVEDEGARSLLVVPLVHNGQGIGAITLYRREVSPFSDDDVRLVESFAAQAVIAIENVRQFREIQSANSRLQTRLDREAAQRQILQIISNTRSDESAVFDEIVKNAAHHCNAPIAGMVLVDENRQKYELVAHHGARAEFVEAIRQDPPELDPERYAAARAILEKRVVPVDDLASPKMYGAADKHRVTTVALEGVRAAIFVPLIWDDKAIGAIGLWRREVLAFSEDEISLAETFAAQAVIAIRNVRQFQEVQARTAEVEEALRYQTATSEVLDVISRSPNDLPPVLDAILQVASRICAPDYAFFAMRDPRDGLYRVAMSHGVSEAFLKFLSDSPIAPEEGSCIGRTALSGKTVFIKDTRNDPSYTWKAAAEIGEYLTTLGVPLISDGVTVGIIVMAHRNAAAFSDKQVSLLETFASQAVIAINNTRLFKEVQARTAEVEEALEQQQASAEILSVISQSVEDTQPVFEKILDSCEKLIRCDDLCIFTIKDDNLAHLGAVHGTTGPELLKTYNPMPVEKTVISSVLKSGEVFHCPSGLNATDDHPALKRMAEELGKDYSCLIAPILWKGKPAGGLYVSRMHTDGKSSAFSHSDIGLLESF
ncbi:MAG: GAF domain-containing protein, partial [Pseudomonadota bacterium]